MPLTPVSPDEFCCSHGCFYCLMTRLQFRQQCEATAEHPPLLSLFSFSVLPSFTWINQSSAAISQKLLKAQSRLSKEPVSKHATSSSSLDLPPPPLISWSYAARLITLTVDSTNILDWRGGAAYQAGSGSCRIYRRGVQTASYPLWAEQCVWDSTRRRTFGLQRASCCCNCPSCFGNLCGDSCRQIDSFLGLISTLFSFFLETYATKALRRVNKKGSSLRRQEGHGKSSSLKYGAANFRPTSQLDAVLIQFHHNTAAIFTC